MSLLKSLTPSVRTQHVRGLSTKHISVHNIGNRRNSEVHMQLHSFRITETRWNCCHVHYAVYVCWLFSQDRLGRWGVGVAFHSSKGKMMKGSKHLVYRVWARIASPCCSAWRRVLDDMYKWLKGAGEERHSLFFVVLHHRTWSMATNQNTWKFIWAQESTFIVSVVTTRARLPWEFVKHSSMKILKTFQDMGLGNMCRGDLVRVGKLGLMSAWVGRRGCSCQPLPLWYSLNWRY